jgi:hypothetical protein
MNHQKNTRNIVAGRLWFRKDVRHVLEENTERRMLKIFHNLHLFIFRKLSYKKNIELFLFKKCRKTTCIYKCTHLCYAEELNK